MKLCQRARGSCGACCGLYNRRDLGRAAVIAELRRHTRLLARVEQTLDGFRTAARQLDADGPPPLFPSIRVCPLAGFLDARETRVGCLAHPKATGGEDLRACGVYDVETCEAFLCPSHASVDEREALIAERLGDFYLYGLVVTDGPFLRTALRSVERAVGETLSPAHLEAPRFASALRRLLAIKEELAPGSDGLFGAFRHGASPAGEDVGPEAILETLGADARSGNDADQLEAELARRLDGCAAAWGAAAVSRK
jgi:hypothetical protein